MLSARRRSRGSAVRGGATIDKKVLFGSLLASFLLCSAYVYTDGTEAAHIPPLTDQGRHGQQLFQEHNCIACHQFYGLGGYMGPDLTNVISTRGAAYSRAFLTAGTARMPKFDLDEAEVDALIAFLDFVDRTGTYPAQNFEITWYGGVVQEDDPK